VLLVTPALGPAGGADARRPRWPLGRWAASATARVGRALLLALTELVYLSLRFGAYDEAESAYLNARRDARQAHRHLTAAATPIARAGVLEDLAHAESRMAAFAVLCRPGRVGRTPPFQLALGHELVTRLVENAAATEVAIARGPEDAAAPALVAILPEPGRRDVAHTEAADTALWVALTGETDRGRRASYYELIAGLARVQLAGSAGAQVADCAARLARSEHAAAALLSELE
jgi:hypothetical protein